MNELSIFMFIEKQVLICIFFCKKASGFNKKIIFRNFIGARKFFSVENYKL